MPARLIDDGMLWDGFIDESNDSTLFHKWGFLRIMEKYTGYKLLPYGIFKGDEMVGAMPLFYNKEYGMKLLYSPPPTSAVNVPYLGLATGPLLNGLRPHEKEEARGFIIGELKGLIERLSPNYLTIGLAPGTGDARPFIWSGFEVEHKYTYAFDLQKPLDTIWDSIEHDCRKEIRNASKNTLTLKRAYDADLFVDIMRNGLKKVGKTFYHRQGPAYIREVLETFPDNVQMYFLYHGDDVACASVNCGFHGRFLGWMGNTVVDTGVRANQYMLWELLKLARSEGYTAFENIGADEKRLNLAKTKFNPDLVPCYQILKRDLVYRTAKYGMAKLEKATGS
jgi:hypothetical protein